MLKLFPPNTSILALPEVYSSHISFFRWVFYFHRVTKQPSKVNTTNIQQLWTPGLFVNTSPRFYSFGGTASLDGPPTHLCSPCRVGYRGTTTSVREESNAPENETPCKASDCSAHTTWSTCTPETFLLHTVEVTLVFASCVPLAPGNARAAEIISESATLYQVRLY